MAKQSDAELLQILGIDRKTLDRFRHIQAQTIKEAKKTKSRFRKIKVIGISGSARSDSDMAKEKSNSETLLEVSLEKCKKLGADVELIALRDFKIDYCKACYSTVNTQCHHPCSCYPTGTPSADDMSNTLYDKILTADAIIFATPVNNFKISTLLAAFIDRCISLDGSLAPADPNDPKNKELNTKHMKYIEMTADQKVPGSGLLRRFLGKTAGIIVTGHEEGASMVISQLFLTLNHFGMVFPPFSNMYAMSNVCKSTYEDKPQVLSDCYTEEAELLAKNVMTMAKQQKKRTEWTYDYRAN